MIYLDQEESRVLGVLVEKAHTSSGYPMSLNAITVGCNQKSNRDPVVNFDEDRVMAALDRLRCKGLVLFADTLGSRVTKFRHNSRDVLAVDDNELVVLAELLLRGPQTASELRIHASRMRPLEPADVQASLEKLMNREEPLAATIPGQRAQRFAQLLCPALNAIARSTDAAPEQLDEATATQGSSSAATAADADRLTRLEAEIADVRAILHRLADALGASEILDPHSADEHQDKSRT